MDRSSDLVATVGGSGADPALTTSTVLGGRSLRFRAGVSCIQDLVALAAIAIERSDSADYKEAFSWIDNIRLVEDTDLVNELRRQIALELISNPESPSVDTILPDDLIEVGDDRSIRYIVFPYERGVGSGRVMLTTSAIADVLDRSDDPRGALDDELRFLDESETRIGVATILECVSANLRVGDEDFIAYDGDFYLVDQGFVNRIDNEVGRVPIYATTFPPYRGQPEPAARQNRERIEVVFGFLGDWKGRSIISLPLFSRISLASEARRIANLGFRPTVALISIR